MGLIDCFRLDGKVAVVTGASSGLGAAIAVGLADAGADVVLGARRPDLLQQRCGEVRALGRRCAGVVSDVTQQEDCERLVAAAVDELGRVDILVNNAGVGYAATALQDKPGDFARVVGVNLLGSYLMAQAFGRACIDARHGGSIVNISSVLALSGGPLPQTAYSASKAGVLGMTRDLAMQWSGRYGIRVNALAPGFFHSEMTEELLGSDAGRRAVLEATPMGRVGAISELLGPLLLLASDAGSYITGATVAVDGGWSLH